MRTFIVQLEPHDDVISTRDKIAWSKANRILLVWPRRGKGIQRRLDLVLLQRYSGEVGAQLGIVTQDKEIQDLAIQTGIPTFESIPEAQKSPWRRARIRKGSFRPNFLEINKIISLRKILQKKQADADKEKESPLRFPFFIVGVIAVISLIVFFLPGADIYLTMKEKEQSINLSVWASPTLTEADINGGLPAIIKNVIVEGQDQQTTTGQIILADKTSSGRVRFKNISGKEVTIPAGTIVLTQTSPAIKFETKIAQTIPPTSRSVEVEIQALQPGSPGNVTAGQINSVEGMVGSEVLVENLEPTSGGTDISSAAPSQEDYERLKERLLLSLGRTALREFQAGSGDEAQLIQGSIQPSKTIKEDVQPGVGRPGNQLILRLTIEFTGWFYSPKSLEKVTSTVMDASLTKGYESITGTQTLSITGAPIVEEHRISWNVAVRRQIRATWTKEKVISTVCGLTPENAMAELEKTLELKQPPVIRLKPGWWPRLPNLPFSIQVVAQ